MLRTLRELNDYSSFLPRKIRTNVNREKYEILCEIKKIATRRKNNSYNVTSVIKLFNSYETINTTKHRSFHFYIFVIKYLWYSLQNRNISPNLKTYICQVISNILKNIKKYILDNFFFDYDVQLIEKDVWRDKSTPVEEYYDSDVTDNSYAHMSDHYYDEYKNVIEESDIDSSINENKGQLVSDFYYVTFNGIYEKAEDCDGSFLNKEIIIHGKNEYFRLYVQKCIFNVIEYRYLFDLLYDYLTCSNINNREYSHNAYKNYIDSVLSILVNLKPFCYYNIDVHNLLVHFAFNNFFPVMYEEYVDKRESCFVQSSATTPVDADSALLINTLLNKKVKGPLEEKLYRENNFDIVDEIVVGVVPCTSDLTTCSVDQLEVCARYNTIFLNFVILSQLSSDDLCYKLIKHGKIVYLYKKVKRCNWHSINFAFAKMIYKGLKYAYMYNLNVEKEIQELLPMIFFLFLFYIKLPNNIQLSSSKYFIPDEYTILINDDDSVVKTISKIFVLILNKKFRKEGAKEANERVQNKEKENIMLHKFLTYLEEKNFSVNIVDGDILWREENITKGSKIDTPSNVKEDSDMGTNFSIFENVDTHDFLNIITSLFMPHIHPSNVGKHIGNINLFVNSFLYSFIRKLKREEIYLREIAKIESVCGKSIPTKESLNRSDDYVMNYFISEEDKNIVVDKFTALAVQGMFPKSSKGSSLFENIIKHLCIIDINCLDIFVKKILECLGNVNTSTQICNCLLSLCLLLPLIIKYRAKYLKDILYIINMGIDICDIYKSFTIFSFLSILFSYIPIVKMEKELSAKDRTLAMVEFKRLTELEKGNVVGAMLRKEVPTDEQISLLLAERKELIDYLCYWVMDFFEKILYFVKYTKNAKSRDNKKQNGENKENKLENDLYTGLKSTIVSLIVHLDHDIVYELCQKFLNSIEQENAKSLSIIPYAIGLINNRKIFDTLFNWFYKKVITKRRKKKLGESATSGGTTHGDGENREKGENEQDEFIYTKNEYANDDTVKCYLHFLASLIRRANGDFLNVEDIYHLVEIYIVEENNTVFKYICKIVSRFLDHNFCITVKNFSFFDVSENMSWEEKVRTLASWCVPWHVVSSPHSIFQGEGKLQNENFDTYSPIVGNKEEVVKWKTPTLENVKRGKQIIYFLLDHMIDLLIQCNIPISSPNLKNYVEKRKLKQRNILWKFPLNHSNVISRIYKILKCIIKPLSSLYPDERYNFHHLLTKCNIINTKLSFYIYVYASEIVIDISLHILNIPTEILHMSSIVQYNVNDEKLEYKSSFSSVNAENVIKDTLIHRPIDKEEIKRVKDNFFTNVINTMETHIKGDAKIQRKIIKCIHFLLLKCSENTNTSLYNEYINTVLSFTYNMYPFSYNYDIIKSQYINNIFFLFNERLKHRKKNYCFSGYREQLCNVLFFVNLSIYSQVRSYAQNTIKLILPSFKIIKVPFLKICAFYLKGFAKLYALKKGGMQEGISGSSGMNKSENGVDNIQADATENGGEKGNENDDENGGSIESANHGRNEAQGDGLSRLGTQKFLGEMSTGDYFENKCIGCFNGIIVNITNNSGLVKKIGADVYLLKKYIKIILTILRLEIQKEDVTLKCMKLVYSIINSRFIKNDSEQKKKKKKKKKNLNELIFFLKEESEKENNVYGQVVILSFFICFSNFAIENYTDFYFHYLVENFSIKKNVHVYNLAFCGFIKVLRYFNSNNKCKALIPITLTNVFKNEKMYRNFVEICIYKNLKSKKKSNSINAIIVNLCKVHKSFKGFSHISEAHVRDFFAYYAFFKFLVNLQGQELSEEEAREAENTDILACTVNEAKEPDIERRCGYIGGILPILRELQMDAHADNEYKCTLISLVCPLLFALRKLKNSEEVDSIMENVVALLEKEIAVVNVEVFNYWLYYFHLLFIHIKKKYIHRYDKLFRFSLHFEFQDVSNLVFKKKMQLLSIMLLYSIHKNNNIIDNSIVQILQFVSNDNITVRQIVGDLVARILYVLHDRTHYPHLNYIYYNVMLFLYREVNQVVLYFQSSENISKQCTHIYVLETMAYLTVNMFTNRCMYVLGNLSAQFLKMFLLSLQLVDNFINGLVNKAIKCFLCPSLYLFNFDKIKCEDINGDNHIYEMFPKGEEDGKHSFDLLLGEHIGTIIMREFIFLLSKNNWKIRNAVLQFCFYFHSYYCIFFYNKKENCILMNIFISLLVDKCLEIQNLSRTILSSVFCYYDELTLKKISNYFLIIANPKKNNSCFSPNGEITTKTIEKKKYIAIYTLISIVNSFPNYVPEWLPPILISVARMSNNTGHNIKKEIEKCIQNFLRTHKDEWEYKYKLVFTEEQLNILDMYKGGLNYFT
ncbi:conserved Plasmodium protein, unknown function [Plasmodium ovale]|uniref:Proteasome activator complex subunit 4 C-terminal domain-containing protein n=2 Tax=Plasmodium ovale TaxID=36330 RepID=A0A1A8X0P9_PLAOA|nr:conserved Plasmodium protein, unknown function [Plasmodium ovale curtisi]SBS98175.1 conserved Plasmodium protein, unknown function [Plasmodium ovale curtisi]SCQ16913.1 conserved Plasmodium protein, unknown function [Plasmodium ovale]